MLSQGYNNQTVSSYSFVGNQITFTYSINHGYVADRVITIIANSVVIGEVVIDSVTDTTITFTYDNFPSSLSNPITTIVSSLGWELVYELNHIHIYKFKHIDDTDMYARLCFQNIMNTSVRACISVGIGRTIDLALGTITDPNCLPTLATCATVADSDNLRWEFSNQNTAHINYTYSQGYSVYGRACIVGSKYHIALLGSYHSTSSYKYINGILPFSSTYSILNYPLLFANNWGAHNTTQSSSPISDLRTYVGKYRVETAPTSTNTFNYSFSSSYYPTEIESQEVTSCFLIDFYLYDTQQYIGSPKGIFNVALTPSTLPLSNTNLPSVQAEVDFNNKLLVHYSGSTSTIGLYFAFPIEEIKSAI